MSTRTVHDPFPRPSPHYQKKTPPKPPSESDEWQSKTTEMCARSMAHWLKGTVNTQRPINTLTLDELKAMTENALAVWIREASQRVGTAPTEEERTYLRELLFG